MPVIWDAMVLVNKTNIDLGYPGRVKCAGTGFVMKQLSYLKFSWHSSMKLPFALVTKIVALSIAFTHETYDIMRIGDHEI